MGGCRWEAAATGRRYTDMMVKPFENCSAGLISLSAHRMADPRTLTDILPRRSQTVVVILH